MLVRPCPNYNKHWSIRQFRPKGARRMAIYHCSIKIISKGNPKSVYSILRQEQREQQPRKAQDREPLSAGTISFEADQFNPLVFPQIAVVQFVYGVVPMLMNAQVRRTQAER